MAWSLTLSSLISRASPTKADLALKAEQQAKYVKDLWIVLACVVALLALIRTLRFASSFIPSGRHALRPPTVEKTDLESMQSGRNDRISWKRLPAAISSTFRVVAFRSNIPVGPGAVVSIAELLFVLGYISIMLVLLLINSESPVSIKQSSHIHSSLIKPATLIAGFMKTVRRI